MSATTSTRSDIDSRRSAMFSNPEMMILDLAGLSLDMETRNLKPLATELRRGCRGRAACRAECLDAFASAARETDIDFPVVHARHPA
jgi:hypothetical protein